MKKKSKKLFFIGASLTAVFVLWTVSVRLVDVVAIGPQGSSVGFASLNGFVRDVVGVNMSLYLITDWLSLVPLCTALGVCLSRTCSMYQAEKSVQGRPKHTAARCLLYPCCGGVCPF